MNQDDPDQTHALLTQDAMNEAAKIPPHQTKAEFWWNHLTFEQRLFIYREHTSKPVVHGIDFDVESMHKINWTNYPGYPK